jgi:diguanylate cyclase (GGDEF)-like protein
MREGQEPNGKADWLEIWDSLPSAFALLNREGMVVAVNQAWRKWGLPGSSGSLHTAQPVELAEALRGVRQEVFWRPNPGPDREFRVQMVPLPESGGVLVQCLEMTAAGERERGIWERWEQDELTGLLSRRALLARLGEMVDRQTLEGGEVALLFIDLDRFKETNDTYGHYAGDHILVEASDRLRKSSPPFSLLGRLGGDEFLVAWENPGPAKELNSVAEAVLRALSRSVQLEGRALPASASMGIAVFPQDAANTEDLIRVADLAMLRAKEDGRRGWRRFDQRLQAELDDRYWIERDLSRSLAADQFWVAYQPQIDLHTQKVVGAEALLRWNHPAGAAVPMSRVIDVAESSGLILPIGNWVIQQAIAQLASWRAIDPALTMSVNLSAVQFNQQDIDADILQLLEMYETPPQRLKVEITESVFLHRSSKVRNALYALHEAGVGLHLDDFGTGYSSLSYLQSIPFEAVKIDASFLEGIGTVTQDEAIVDAIVKLAQALRIYAVAEGVENEVQVRFLERAGCPVGQGFHWARPLNAEDFQAFLMRQQAGDGLGFAHNA